MIPLQRCRECHTSQYGKGRPGRRFVGLVGLFIFVLAERLRLTHLPTFHQNSFALREKRSALSPLSHPAPRLVGAGGLTAPDYGAQLWPKSPASREISPITSMTWSGVAGAIS